MYNSWMMMHTQQYTHTHGAHTSFETKPENGMTRWNDLCVVYFVDVRKRRTQMQIACNEKHQTISIWIFFFFLRSISFCCSVPVPVAVVSIHFARTGQNAMKCKIYHFDSWFSRQIPNQHINSFTFARWETPTCSIARINYSRRTSIHIHYFQ